MAYTIWAGNKLEILLKEHLTLFDSLFFEERPWVILQNQNMAHWLKLRLTDLRGVSSSPWTMTPQEAIKRLFKQFQSLFFLTPPTVLFMEDLKTLLFFQLQGLFQEASIDMVLEPLVYYVSRGKEDDYGKRILDLANQIAGIFYSYATNSSHLTNCLDHIIEPDFLSDDVAKGLWEWQSVLWRKVFHNDLVILSGCAMQQVVSLVSREGASFVDKKDEPLRNNRPRVVLVGSAFLSRQALDFFRVLAMKDLIDVHHLMVLPADLKASKQVSNLNASWGRFARVFLQGIPSFSFDLILSGNTAFLHRLQKALATGDGLNKPNEFDDSLKIFSCTTALRELEVLKEELLAYFDEHPEILLNDVAVLAPDINVYAPFLQAVFSSKENKVPFHVIDLEINNEAGFYAGLRALLDLLSPVIERAKVFALARHPCFQEARKVSNKDVDCWLDFTNQTGIFRENVLNSVPTAHSWLRAFERFLAGLALEDEEGLGLFWKGSKLFPLSAGVSWTRVVAEYFGLIDEIRQAIKETFHPKSFDGWIDFLGHLVNAFLHDTQDEAWGVVVTQLHKVTQSLDKAYGARLLSWSAFVAFVHDQLHHLSYSRGRLLTQGVHFSSLKPLRALPFQLIVVLGLNEGDFPRLSSSSFDLGLWDPSMEDLSSTSLDRFSFWETLSSAQDAFWIFYQGRDAQSGEPQLPSTVVSELLNFLEDQGCTFVVHQESVHPFEEKSLIKRGTYSRYVMAQYQALHHRCHDMPIQFILPALSEGSQIVTDRDLQEAFLTPAKFYWKRIGQVSLRSEDRSDKADQEPWQLPFSFKEELRHRLLKELLTNNTLSFRVEDFFEAAFLSGQVSHGVFFELDKKAWQDLFYKTETQVRSWYAHERLSKALLPSVLWNGRPWVAPLLWQNEDRLIIVWLKEQSYLRLKDQWRMALKVLPLFLLYDSEEKSKIISQRLPTLTLVSSQGPITRFDWNLNAQESASLARTAQEYWQELMRYPLPFYPNLVEELFKHPTFFSHNNNTSSQGIEDFLGAWEIATKPGFQPFVDRESLASCHYASHFLRPTRQDFVLWTNIFRYYSKSLFQPLSTVWQPTRESK